MKHSTLYPTLTHTLLCLLLAFLLGASDDDTPSPTCGDGVKEGNEACDDGNTTECDGCSANCTIEACGNGIQECLETCDDGNTTSGDGCSASCTDESQEECGNGIREEDEECDDGNTTDGDGCSAHCTIELSAECGNGTTEGIEECDDGNTTACDGCSAHCTIETCGNGTAECDEECDDGNTVNGDGCSAACMFEGYTHTITLDCTIDFTVDELFPSGTVGQMGYITWDSTNLYLGFDSVDLGVGSDQIWLLVYLAGDAAGSTSGVTYNTQGPLLPFAASHHLRYKGDNTYTDLQEWDGTAFTSITTTTATSHCGNYLELAIPLAEIGVTTTLDLHMGIIREEANNEASWAPVPSTSYGDGYDPDYTTYFHFVLTAPEVPGSYTPL